MAKKKLLWITDPWNTLDHENDTTLRLIQESIAMKNENFWADVRSVRFENNAVLCDAEPILKIVNPRSPNLISKSALVRFEIREATHVFYRTDPPVDLSFSLPLQLLELAQAKHPRIKFVNPLSSLLSTNEKLECLSIPAIAAKSFVSSDPARLISTFHSWRKAVVKPLYQAQSKGVRVLETDQIRNEQEEFHLFESATERGKLPVLLQEYLPEITKGEKRLWFVKGKLIASVAKIPAQGQSVIDMDQGGRVEKTKLSATELKAAKLIGAHLKRRKILWAAVDLIAGKVTDFNFTSPGLIAQMEAITGKNLARELLKAL